MLYMRQLFVVFVTDNSVLYKMPSSILGKIPGKIYLWIFFPILVQKTLQKASKDVQLHLDTKVCIIMIMVCIIMSCTQVLCIIVIFIQVRKSMKYKA